MGIVMLLEENRPFYEKLADSVNGRSNLDDSACGIKIVFQDIAAIFHYEKVLVNLSLDTYAVIAFEEINPNDITYIRTERYSEYIALLFL